MDVSLCRNCGTNDYVITRKTNCEMPWLMFAPESPSIELICQQCGQAGGLARVTFLEVFADEGYAMKRMALEAIDNWNIAQRRDAGGVARGEL